MLAVSLRRTLCTTALVGALALPLPTFATPSRQQVQPAEAGASALTQTIPVMNYTYDITWLGIRVADLQVKIRKNGEGKAVANAMIRTYGLAKHISKYFSNTTSSAVLGLTIKGAPYQSFTTSLFHTYFRLRGKERNINMTYDASSHCVVTESNVPPENRAKRPAVKEEHKCYTYDPLTAALEARRRFMRGEKSFDLKMYDGRRLSTLHLRYVGREANGQHHITVRETFEEGFTNNEQQARADRDPTIHVYTDPATWLPIWGRGESLIGTAYGKLTTQR